MIEIRHRWNGKVLYTAETAADVRQAVEEADLSGADLSGAVLRGADLSGAVLRGAVLRGAVLRGADLSDADLSGADLSDAVLRGADLSGAVLSDAVLRGAVLRGAVLSGAVLRGAVLRGAVLRDADLRDADLRDADLSGADDHPRHPLHHVRMDLWAILDLAPREVAGLRAALVEGRVNGSVYEGACSCLVGTIATVRGCDYRALVEVGIVADAHRPAEQWFIPIREGHAPVDKPEREGQYRAAVAVRWIDEWRVAREALVANWPEPTAGA